MLLLTMDESHSHSFGDDGVWARGDLLNDENFAQLLYLRCQSARMAADLEIKLSHRPVRLRPGDAVKLVVLPGPAFHSVSHFWHGSRITCTEQTSALLISRRACLICEAKRSRETWADDFSIQNNLRVYLPCVIEATRFGGEDWRVWEKRFPALLEADEDFEWDWRIGGFTAGQTLKVERFQNATRLWAWRIDRCADHKPVSRAELLNLRRRMPGICVPMPDAEEVADFLKVAEANWLNSPEPGRAERLCNALPGALLLPCYFASKRTRVRWAEGAWSAKLVHEYGLERLDKGNIAALLGPASDELASIDWDTDRFDTQFRARNRWAVACMRSWASRPPGNYWFRVRDLPADLARVFKLRHGKEQVGELRLGSCITLLSGYHPSGARYQIANLGQIPEITLHQIVWPDGVNAARGAAQNPPTRSADWDDDMDDQPCIHLNKVEGLREHPRKPGALHGRCPVCASKGKDRHREHLIVYANGRWTTRGTCQCEHSEIFALIGLKYRPKKPHQGGARSWAAFGKLR